MTAPPKVFTIPPSRSFVDVLAAGLLADADGRPERLAEMTVLVPTRRAVRALTDAFLRQSEGRPTILPRLAAIGDVAEDALVMERIDVGGDAALALPPAIGELRRNLLLSRLIEAEQKGLGRARGGGGVKRRPLTADQASRLATELARLLDQVQIERLSFDRLETLVPDDYAEHWQIVLRFLRLLTLHWPNILSQQGLIDGAERRNRLLEAQTRQWQEAPPATPIIAAGSTGSVPATADLLRVVAGLPHGVVILPGLDHSLDEASWRTLAPTHPQYGMARLLAHIGIEPAAVADWLVDGPVDKRSPREMLISEALRPSVTVTQPTARMSTENLAEAVGGVTRIDCATAEEEAGVVALLLREVLDTEAVTAALITPDRRLARRVAAELLRWGVRVDDSAGVPLALAPAGTFLRLTARMATNALAPIDLLAALKHPLATAGQAPAEFRAHVRELELAALRGPRPGPGFSGLRRALRGAAHADLREWLATLAAAGSDFIKIVGRRRARLPDLVRHHVGFAEWLAAGIDESGADRLWAGDGGEAAACFVAELSEAADGHPTIPGREYPGLLDALLAGRVVRPKFGRHPRLAIWGPLEARLQHADRIVLGGLNEGVWPEEVRADPWMSRPMRETFGLPPAERQIGLSAHDFAQAFCASEVILTRAERVDGTPTVDSRWLLRLDVALQRHGLDPARLRQDPRLGWWRGIDSPAEIRPRQRPRPCPPVARRPRSLSVTQIETWLRDPYAIYARHILGLQPLEALDADPDAADRGTIIHHALDRFLRAYPGDLPADAYTALLEIGAACFRDLLDRPGVRAFWWPRFERIARWFIAQEGERRRGLAATWSEVRGAVELSDGTAPFRLRATADRIDRLADGRVAIIDYKTGTVPSVQAMRAGLAPQLPLEAMIAAAGGFDGIEPAETAEMAYWQLTGGAPAGTARAFNPDPPAAMAAAEAGLRALIQRFDDPATPYLSVPRPAAAPRYSDYAHLARVIEWSAGALAGES